jgi:hypothetical protein
LATTSKKCAKSSKDKRYSKPLQPRSLEVASLHTPALLNVAARRSLYSLLQHTVASGDRFCNLSTLTTLAYHRFGSNIQAYMTAITDSYQWHNQEIFPEVANRGGLGDGSLPVGSGAKPWKGSGGFALRS